MALTALGADIWLADGPAVQSYGFRYPTRMAVIRLSDGGLFIWSPVALTEGLRTEIASLGEVRHLVAPNSLHHVFLGEWREAFPSATLWAAPGLTQTRKDIPFDGELGDSAPGAWADDIDQAVVRGNRITTEVVFFHRSSGVVLFTDLIQQFPHGAFRGLHGLIARLDLMTEPEPTVPRKFRLAFTGRRAARAALARILAWPATRVVMAHGAPVERDGQAFIARAFRWLTG